MQREKLTQTKTRYEEDTEFSNECEPLVREWLMSQSKVLAAYPVPGRNKKGDISGAQKAGWDWILVLENEDGKPRLETIEVKCRKKWYPDDLCFEVWSCLYMGNVGWADDPKINPTWFLYCAPKLDQWKLFRWRELKGAWVANREDWINRHGLVKAGRSDARNCAVPYSELLPAIEAYRKEIDNGIII